MADSRELQNRDRLSELPDSLIITILSCLEMSDAVMTTVLSKRWKDRWTSVTSLNFSYSRLYGLDTYRSFIHAALLRWKGAKILRLDLSFSPVNPPSRDLHSWLLFAIGKQVEELLLCFRSLRYVDSYYSPPQRLNTCSSIRKLTLSYVKLSVPENVQLSQLTSLTVEVPVLRSELGMTRLLSGALMLEELALLSMEITEDYSIRSESLKKLQIETIGLHSALSIWAPNLSTLEFIVGFCGYDSWKLELDVPSLTTAILDFHRLSIHNCRFHEVFGSIRHVQSFTLSDRCIELLLDLKRKGTSVEFSNAKHLQLFLNDKVVVYLINEAVGERLLAVLEMFPDLLTLIATVDIHTPPPMDGGSASKKKIDIPLPHLKTCEISLNATNSSILRAIEAVLENGEMLEKMVLRLRNDATSSWGALEKVLSMRRCSSKAKGHYKQRDYLLTWLVVTILYHASLRFYCRIQPMNVGVKFMISSSFCYLSNSIMLFCLSSL